VRWVIVQHDVDFLIEVDDLLPDQVQELEHALLVGGLPKHEKWVIDTSADGSVNGDSVAPELVVHPSHRVLRVTPGFPTAHPQVERRLIEVDDNLSLL